MRLSYTDLKVLIFNFHPVRIGFHETAISNTWLDPKKKMRCMKTEGIWRISLVKKNNVERPLAEATPDKPLEILELIRRANVIDDESYLKLKKDPDVIFYDQ